MSHHFLCEGTRFELCKTTQRAGWTERCKENNETLHKQSTLLRDGNMTGFMLLTKILFVAYLTL